jgi:hypothetical protein
MESDHMLMYRLFNNPTISKPTAHHLDLSFLNRAEPEIKKHIQTLNTSDLLELKTILNHDLNLMRQYNASVIKEMRFKVGYPTNDATIIGIHNWANGNVEKKLSDFDDLFSAVHQRLGAYSSADVIQKNEKDQAKINKFTNEIKCVSKQYVEFENRITRNDKLVAFITEIEYKRVFAPRPAR